MNRADQLRDALQSCVNSKLPEETEFVIVDNASTDNTRNVVEDFFKLNKYPNKYEYEKENLGVGGGRSRAYELAGGEFAYFLDDDAVINPQNYETFFIEPLLFFDAFPDVATITTNIIDKAWQGDRTPILAKSWKRGDLHCCFMFFGGSHFIRCSVFKKRYALYENIMYGFEELSTSIYAMDNGYVHVFMPNISMIHCPNVDKWKDEEKLTQMNRGVCCTQYVIKSQMYPLFMRPLLWIAFKRRWKKYVGKENHSMSLNEAKQLGSKESKIAFFTLARILMQFGLSAL